MLQGRARLLSVPAGRGVARRGAAWRGVARRGVAWRGVAWRGVQYVLAGQAGGWRGQQLGRWQLAVWCSVPGLRSMLTVFTIRLVG